MTSNINTYHQWYSDHPTIPELPQHEFQDFHAHDDPHPHWLSTYYSTDCDPSLNSSNTSSPEISYSVPSSHSQFRNSEDYLDFQRIGTPQTTLDDEEFEPSTQVGGGAKKRVRKREQNRATQRAYRDRQRGKMAELQAKILALVAQNEELQARNFMLEAAFRQMMANRAVGG
ncbi:hypothetical protein AC578_1368 [Pseudocercospora eumusae]|uniref:BZIP domain-containing protein n=1 Tax=Pseudocercospora eumusae TaxID=321146 RepID=A0A139HUI5_9PEZI|nr:hypothetical protein AC578_1368 [Pseudocercospora eumusae]